MLTDYYVNKNGVSIEDYVKTYYGFTSAAVHGEYYKGVKRIYISIQNYSRIYINGAATDMKKLFAGVDRNGPYYDTIYTYFAKISVID